MIYHNQTFREVKIVISTMQSSETEVSELNRIQFMTQSIQPLLCIIPSSKICQQQEFLPKVQRLLVIILWLQIAPRVVLPLPLAEIIISVIARLQITGDMEMRNAQLQLFISTIITRIITR